MELVQPFIHQGMTAVVGAFPEMMMKGEEYKELFKGIREVIVEGIAGDLECEARFERGGAGGVCAAEDGGCSAADGGGDKCDSKMHWDGGIDDGEGAGGGGGWGGRTAALWCRSSRAILMSMRRSLCWGLEAEMKKNELWPGEKPAGEIEVKGAFGSENIRLCAVAGVGVDRTGEGDCADAGGLSAAQRGGGVCGAGVGWVDYGEVVRVLGAFDDMVEGMRR